MKPGPRNLITDVAGLRVGHAVDAALRSGCTVLVGDRPFTAAVHVMGGAPGTRETDLLAPDRLVQEVDALVLSGGSAFGLDACSGVADGLRAMGRGFAVGDQRVPIVSGFPSGSPLTTPPLAGVARASRMPARCGVAIEVPEIVLYPPFSQVDLIAEPGSA